MERRECRANAHSTIHTTDSGWYSLRDDTHLHLLDTLEQSTTSTQAYWPVHVPAGQSISVRVVDALGRNYTTYPKIVGESRDVSCLPQSLQPAPTAQAAGITYNYNTNNSSRLYTSIILAAIGGAITLIIVLVIICVCRRRDKKRQKEQQERDANPRPTYAQFFPYPGAAPVLYVQLTPHSPYVPVGATPEEAAGIRQPLMPVDPNTPLSRAASPAMSQVQVPGGAAMATEPANAVASGSGTHSAEPASAPSNSQVGGGSHLGYNVRTNASASSLGTVPSRSG
jgi:hypothetical protein